GTPSRGVNSIDIVDANTVWVGSYDGTNTSNYITDFSKTINGGTLWTAGTITTGLTGVGLGNISAIDGDTAWASIFHPTQAVATGIWKTTDGGVSWNKQTTAAFTAASFPDFVYFWNANNGIAVGDPLGGYFEVYTTADGGTTWVRTANTGNQLQASSSSEYGYTNDFSVVGNTLWFGSTTGRVFKTTDMGLTFTKASVANGVTDVQKVSFADAITGYAFMHTAGNKSYKIARTLDGGTNWSAIINTTSIADSTVLGADITAVPGTNALISVGSDVTAKGSSWSGDGGLSWELMEDTSLAPQRLSVRFLDASTGWAGTFNIDAFTSGISKFNGMVGIGAAGNSTKNVTAFPNPAADLLTLNINGLNGKQLLISVFNVMGEKISSEKMQTGSPVYFKHIDLSALSAGLYFVEVTDGNNKFVNKFIKQ
ncbi:MAG: T9SS type A sorting domain-containing protein, partial [Bacteroidia bacterium]|nr:T9SS type A sorting domain-containing protein [Bacteroidia bacterium]